MAEVDSQRPALVQKPMKTMRWMRDDEPSPERNLRSQMHSKAFKLGFGVLNDGSPGTLTFFDFISLKLG